MSVREPLTVLLVDLEPALAAALLKLFRAHRDFRVSTLSEQECPPESGPPKATPDVLLVTPHRPQRLSELRRRFPSSYILARVRWDDEHYFGNPDLDGTVDKLASFQILLLTLRQLQRERLPSRLAISA